MSDAHLSNVGEPHPNPPSTPFASFPFADYARLTGEVGWIDPGDRTLLTIAGGDRAKFLHNLCTNDVKGLSVGDGCEAFFTNVQGKILGHVFLFADRDVIVLETAPGQGATLLAHLDRYLIREDVQLASLGEEWGQIWVFGPRAGSELATLAELRGPEALPARRLAHATVQLGGAPVVVTRAPWGGAYWLRFRTGDRQTIELALAARDIRACSNAAAEALRVECGFPEYGQDITIANLPQEVDRDRQAISFRKGCYLGQETVARIDALGHVNRLLRRVRISASAIPAAGSELRREGKPAGNVTSGTYSPAQGAPVALAWVRREASPKGTVLQSSLGEATVLEAVADAE